MLGTWLWGHLCLWYFLSFWHGICQASHSSLRLNIAEVPFIDPKGRWYWFQWGFQVHTGFCPPRKASMLGTTRKNSVFHFIDRETQIHKLSGLFKFTQVRLREPNLQFLFESCNNVCLYSVCCQKLFCASVMLGVRIVSQARYALFVVCSPSSYADLKLLFHAHTWL